MVNGFEHRLSRVKRALFAGSQIVQGIQPLMQLNDDANNKATQNLFLRHPPSLEGRRSVSVPAVFYIRCSNFTGSGRRAF